MSIFMPISFLFALLLMFVLVPFGIKLANKFSILDIPQEERKVHKSPIPVIGGIIIFIVFIVLNFAFSNMFFESDGTFTFSIGMSVILFLVGVIDDRIDVNPLLKLKVEILFAIIFLASGICDNFFIIDASSKILFVLQYIFYVVLIVGTINALNLIDGIDGLAGCVFLICFLWIAGYAFVNKQFYMVNTALILVGALLGFLYYNFSSSRKIFLGDGGTLFLSSLVICCFFITSSNSGSANIIILNRFVLGFSALIGLPIIDALIVFKNRIKRGKSPFNADRSHIHHRLLVVFGSQKKVTMVLCLYILFVLVSTMLISSFFSFIVSAIFMITCYTMIYIPINQYYKFLRHKDILQQIEKNQNAHA